MGGKVYDKDGIVLYNADCIELLPDITPESVRLLLTDPPYGNSYTTSRDRSSVAKSNRYPNIVGNHSPFDPSPLIKYGRKIIFGGNFFADKLPIATCWIIWDKLDGLKSNREIGFNDGGDCELAWTNFYGPPRIIRHRWVGMIRASEAKQRLRHPTQKPIAVMEKLIKVYSDPGDTILDSYCGSGSTLIAARNLGRKAIGIEIEPAYCDVTIQRLSE
jgi:site-specific DNA-methyltransferase (adenine-specific)